MARSRIEDEGERIQKLLVIEIRRIIEDLESRQVFLLDVWNRHRDRGPFLDTVFSRWDTLTFPDLIHLPTPDLLVVDAFYRELNELRFFFRYTEMMPTTLEENYSQALGRLKTIGELAMEALGGAPPAVIDFDDPPLVKRVKELMPEGGEPGGDPS